ncbi:hypothetical protein PV11_01839 [Exophiala sideris]|uniref:Uncharacterized protein n=1 Tax=Exophiala sideris TaxID=1016849 RepID=A0A0D1XDX9_9EURO|nr:hypothetical protein PV11_01839 [Exophiala sideris]
MLLPLFAFLLSALVAFATSQSLTSSDGYTGYTLEVRDDTDSTVYETDSTDTSNGTVTDSSSPPDVFLNATVFVGEIDLTVKNLTAKLNLDAQVLNLLNFNAGVDLSINRVALTIQNVSARVELEVRLENLVMMINDTLSSIDLNPVIATLGNDVGTLVNDTVGGLTSDLSARSFELQQGILYSVNDYTGNTHTNRVLDQAGNIVDEFLHNDGKVYQSTIVGSYWHDMTPTGNEKSVILNGENVKELQYTYNPFGGLSVVAAIFLDANSNVVATSVLSEVEGGGTSTIADQS